MPNGKPGDNPITDMLLHGAHPFPADMEEMIRKIHQINPRLLNDLEWQPFDWEEKRDLEKGRQALRKILDDHGG